MVDYSATFSPYFGLFLKFIGQWEVFLNIVLAVETGFSPYDNHTECKYGKTIFPVTL